MNPGDGLPGALGTGLFLILLAFAGGRRLGGGEPGEWQGKEAAGAAALFLALGGLFLASIHAQGGPVAALLCGLLAAAAFLTGLDTGRAAQRAERELEAAPPHPGAWVTQGDVVEALTRLAAARGGRVVGEATRRVLDGSGRLILEARPIGSDRVGLKLRARSAGVGGASTVLTPAAWYRQRRREEPLPPALERFGPDAPARLDGLLEEPGVRRLVLAPGAPQLELALTPRLRLISLQAHPPAGMTGRSEPDELLAAHLERLLGALDGLGRAPRLQSSGSARAAAARIVLYDPTPEATPGQRCPFCRSELEAQAELARCGRCGTVHHAACWEEGGGCTVLGCGARRGARARAGRD